MNKPEPNNTELNQFTYLPQILTSTTQSELNLPCQRLLSFSLARIRFCRHPAARRGGGGGGRDSVGEVERGIPSNTLFPLDSGGINNRRIDLAGPLRCWAKAHNNDRLIPSKVSGTGLQQARMRRRRAGASRLAAVQGRGGHLWACSWCFMVLAHVTSFIHYTCYSRFLQLATSMYVCFMHFAFMCKLVRW